MRSALIHSSCVIPSLRDSHRDEREKQLSPSHTHTHTHAHAHAHEHLRFGNLTFIALTRAHTQRGEVGVHTSCTVWLYSASVEMSSPSRCARRSTLPMWERRKDGEQQPWEASGRVDAFVRRLPWVFFLRTNYTERRVKDRAYRWGEIQWICSLCEWMRITDWTGPDFGAERLMRGSPL